MKNLLLERFKQYIIRYKWFLAAFVVSGIIFKIYPQIDIYVADFFYDEEKGFYLSRHPFSMFVYHGVHYLTYALSVVYILSLIYLSITKKTFFGVGAKSFAFLTLALGLGPGVVSNLILKNNVGRPRPDAIIEFNGVHEFVGPFTFSNACDTNCSFVSGHASLGFYLMVFGLLATGLARTRMLAVGFIFGIIIGGVRVVQGRHFFTDVVFAFFFVYTTMTLIHALMYGFDDDKEKEATT